MHVEYLAACGHDGNLTRERMEEHWRLLKGSDAVLDDELYERGVARARILNTPASKRIDMAAKKGVARAQSLRDPLLWHLATMAAIAYRGDRHGFVHWVLEQPETDRATAGWIFLWLDGHAYLRGVTAFTHAHLSSDHILGLLQATCARSEQIGFVNDRLGLDQEFETDRLKCLEVIEDEELADGSIVPWSLIGRPFGPPQQESRLMLNEGLIIIA